MIKDKASQSKAALVSKPRTSSLHLALLRATTHDSLTPPSQRHLAAFLSFGQGSRAIASAAVEALMDRLQTTRDASVAVKCLIAVHNVVKHGSFILQDQLSVYPSTGGRNYLKRSDFRDNTSPLTWELSSWVRWYALYLEHLLSSSRVLGFFLGSSSSTVEKDKEEEKVSAFMNSDLLRDIDTLASLLEETSKRPDSIHAQGNKLVEEIMVLVGEDYLSAINEISIRVNEFNHRENCLSFGDSVELVCALKRLDDCRESLVELSQRKRAMIESFWGLIYEVRDKVGNEKVYRENKRILVKTGSREKGSESARYGDRVVGYGESIRSMSGRSLSMKKLPFAVAESIGL